jgi:hypothetical protein
MMSLLRILAASASVLLLTACGESVSTRSPHPVDGGGGTQGDPSVRPPDQHEPEDSTGGRGAAAIPSLGNCPPTPPDIASPCEWENLPCTYGDDPISSCRTTTTCTAGRWEDSSAECLKTPEGYCPPEIPSGSCEPLDERGEPARYGDGRIPCVYGQGTYCYCVHCPEGDCSVGTSWECIQPPPDLLCPELLPNFGEFCATAGLTCAYGDACREGGVRVCRDGVWYPRSVDCSEEPL